MCKTTKISRIIFSRFASNVARILADNDRFRTIFDSRQVSSRYESTHTIFLKAAWRATLWSSMWLMLGYCWRCYEWTQRRKAAAAAPKTEENESLTLSGLWWREQWLLHHLHEVFANKTQPKHFIWSCDQVFFLHAKIVFPKRKLLFWIHSSTEQSRGPFKKVSLIRYAIEGEAVSQWQVESGWFRL